MHRIACSLLAFVASAALAQAALTVAPLSREQASAFYTARGFTAAAIAPYAEACVVSFSFRNGGRTALRFRLDDWRAGDGIRFRPLGDWEAAWEKDGVPQAARIAFRWAQFPPAQEFAPGDWIMGMAALERRVAGPFRVTARYSDDKGIHELVSDAVNCGD